MSAHFAVLREAGLVDSDKQGKTIRYRLKMSVLEEALMEFSELLGLNLAQRARRTSGDAALRKPQPDDSQTDIVRRLWAYTPLPFARVAAMAVVASALLITMGYGGRILLACRSKHTTASWWKDAKHRLFGARARSWQHA